MPAFYIAKKGKRKKKKKNIENLTFHTGILNVQPTKKKNTFTTFTNIWFGRRTEKEYS